MIENLKVTLSAADRKAEFILTFDSDFLSDRDMRMVISRDGACEPEVVHLMARVVQPGDTVVDGGANVGFFTCLLAQLVGPAGRVFSVEPSPVNIKKLEANLANNETGNVTVIKNPLCRDEREVTLHLAPHSGFNSLAVGPETVGRYQVRSTTLNDLLQNYYPKLIKLDIEGAELDALKGARGIIKRCPYVVVEMNEEALLRFGASRETVRAFMREWGKDCFQFFADGSLPRLIPQDTAIESDKQNLMLLFCTPDAVSRAWSKVEM